MEYEQGSNITLYATFLDTLGAYASLGTTPKITIYHYKNTVKSIDVTNADMTIDSNSTYFYRHHITDAATQTVYHVEYSVEYTDGNTVIGEEIFHVIPRKYYSKHGGSQTAKVKVENSWSKKEKEDLLSIILKINDKLHEEIDINIYSEFKEDISKLLLNSKEDIDTSIKNIKIPDNTNILDKLKSLNKPIIIDMSETLKHLTSEVDKKIELLNTKLSKELKEQTIVLNKEPKDTTKELLDIMTSLVQIKSNVTKLNNELKLVTDASKDTSLNTKVEELYKLNAFMFNILSKMISTDDLKELLKKDLL